MSGLGTDAVHGSKRGNVEGPIATPVVRASTFTFDAAADIDAAYEGRNDAYIYTRYGNPTVASAAARLAVLEGGEACILTSSGMAAISTAALTFARSGGRILSSSVLYGGTANLFGKVMPRLGIKVEYFAPEDTKGLERLLTEGPADLVYVETPTNPTLKLVDLKAVGGLARTHGVTSMVDSTFASPVNSRPLALGIDVVMHSATKYLGGHCDLTAGALVARKDLITRLHDHQKLLGGSLDADSAYLLERGMKTVHLRVKAANANAQALAERLARHPKVSRVNYPGLASHPQHELAKAQMPGGFGGLLSFDLSPGTKEAGMRFMDALKIVKNAASLGGTESLVMLSVQQSHRNQPDAVLKTAGITPATVRLACGVEDTADLVADVERALAAI